MPAYSQATWLFRYERQHKPVQVLGETVLLGRWSESERRELYLEWIKLNGLDPDNVDHIKLINTRLVHCMVFAAPNQRLLPLAKTDGIEGVQRSVTEGDDERIGIVLAELTTWFNEIEAQKKASASKTESPSESASPVASPASGTSGQ